MAEGGAQLSGPGRGRHTRGDVPFWVHQAVDMLLALLVMIEGARDGTHTALLVTFGAALLLLSLVSDGALGAWALIGRRLHRIVDLAFAAAFAAAPLVFAIRGVLPIAVLEGAALALLWLSFRTKWTKLSPSIRRGGGRLRFHTPNAPGHPNRAPGAGGVPVARRFGAVVGRVRGDGPRTAGRTVGRVLRRARTPRRPS